MERDELMMDQRLKWIKVRMIYLFILIMNRIESISQSKLEDGERTNTNNSYINTSTLAFD